MKFFLSNYKDSIELDFLTSIKIFESSENEKRTKIPLEDYYKLLEKNKDAFITTTIEEIIIDNKTKRKPHGSKNVEKLLKILKAIKNNSKQLTEKQEKYIEKVLEQLQDGSIPMKTIKKTLNALYKIGSEIENPLKAVGTLQKEISPAFLKSHLVETSATTEEKREVILSLYLEQKNEYRMSNIRV